LGCDVALICIGSPVRAEKEISFEAGLPLEQGLQELIAWRRGHITEVEHRRKAAANPNA
jgi:UDP-glucose 4-epimerase